MGGSRSISGRIVSVEEDSVALPDNKGMVKRTRVTLYTDRGLQQFILEDAENLQFADAALRDKVGQDLPRALQGQCARRQPVRSIHRTNDAVLAQGRAGPCFRHGA